MRKGTNIFRQLTNKESPGIAETFVWRKRQGIISSMKKTGGHIRLNGISLVGARRIINMLNSSGRLPHIRLCHLETRIDPSEFAITSWSEKPWQDEDN